MKDKLKFVPQSQKNRLKLNLIKEERGKIQEIEYMKKIIFSFISPIL